VQIVVAVILLLYFLLAIQVIRWVPLSTAMSGGGVNSRAYKMIQNEIGYNRVTLSMMLSGASWAALCCLVLAETRRQRLILLGMAAAMFLGQALTGGRTGYVSWLAVGLGLSLLRWRRLLLVIPVVIMIVFTFLPGVRDRLLQGFVGGTRGNVIVQNDEYEITSGRNLAWPLVIDKIKENPIFGYGREAMTTTGTAGRLRSELAESFPHPHNAYLEVLLDNGLIGFFCIIPFYLAMLWHATRLLLDRENPLCTAVGGVACALVFALLVGAMGGQTFYPREGSVGMWVAMFVMLRVSVERKRAWETGLPLFAEGDEDALELEPDSTLKSA
jgi:O-antigen ligase